MANVYDKNKPYPENRPGGQPDNRPVGQKRSRFSVWTIIAILVVLALVIWLFAFTYGKKEAVAALDLFAATSPVSAVDVLTG